MCLYTLWRNAWEVVVNLSSRQLVDPHGVEQQAVEWATERIKCLLWMDICCLICALTHREGVVKNVNCGWIKMTKLCSLLSTWPAGAVGVSRGLKKDKSTGS
jgi:hypothetical protein